MKEPRVATEDAAITIEDPELLAELNAGLEEAERGEGMDAFEFMRQLRAGTWRDPEVG
jgi:hypothetical protein